MTEQVPGRLWMMHYKGDTWLHTNSSAPNAVEYVPAKELATARELLRDKLVEAHEILQVLVGAHGVARDRQNYIQALKAAQDWLSKECV